ncbi:MAG: uroporphyrinogen-III synthase [Candidatus Dormibacteria bacterium]
MPATQGGLGRLEGRTIAIMQTRHRKVLSQLIIRAGGVAVSAPCLREVRVDEDEPLRQALQRVAARPLDLAVFQTGVGATALLDRAREMDLGHILGERLAAATVVARGPKPLSALLKRGVRVDLRTREPHTTDEVLALLGPVLGDDGLEGYSVLLQHYGAPNRTLLDFVAGRGADVIEAFTYAWALPENLEPVYRCLHMLEQGGLDAVAFTSAAQVENLYLIAEQAGVAAQLTGWLRERTTLAAVGPATAQALADRGLPVAIQPVHPKMVPLVDALVAHLSGATGG